MSRSRKYFQRTITALGFADSCGNMSFNKSVTAVFVAQCVAIVAVWAAVVIYCLLHDRAMLSVSAKIFPPWSFLSFEGLVIGAGFGLKGYLGGKAGLSMSGDENLTTSVNIDAAAVINALKPVGRTSPDSPHGAE